MHRTLARAIASNRQYALICHRPFSITAWMFRLMIDIPATLVTVCQIAVLKVLNQLLSYSSNCTMSFNSLPNFPKLSRIGCRNESKYSELLVPGIKENMSSLHVLYLYKKYRFNALHIVGQKRTLHST